MDPCALALAAKVSRKVAPGPREGLLHEVLGGVAIAAERERQPRDQDALLRLHQGLKIHH